MAVKIRLKRMGKKAVPFYRLVVVDSCWKRDGKTISDVGWYDPCKQPAQKSFKEKEIYKWLENGAQMSETVKSLLKKEGFLAKFRSGDYKNAPESEETEPVSETPESASETSEAVSEAPEPVAKPETAEAPTTPEPETED